MFQEIPLALPESSGLTSVPVCRETLRAEKFPGTLISSNSNTAKTRIIFIILQRSCTFANAKHLDAGQLSNSIGVTVSEPDLQQASFYSVKEHICYSTIIELLLLLIVLEEHFKTLRI